MRDVPWLAVVTATVAAPGVAAAQPLDGDSPAPRSWVAVSDSLHHAAPEAELAFLDSILRTAPDDFEALWRAARAAVTLGTLARGTEIENSWYRRGQEYGRRAVDVDSTDLVARYWWVAAMGAEAVQTDAVNAVRLGTAVYENAHRILRRDSTHAGAVHALGVLNYEVMKLSAVKRLIARRLLGGRAFRLTSWEFAEWYLTRATQLDPENPLYHLDLGRAFLALERWDEARRELELTIALPLRDPVDTEMRYRARLALRRIP